MIQDKNTNVVYVSEWLTNPKKNEAYYKDFYDALKSKLDELGIKLDLLKGTNDYWARDYMPIQLNNGTFLTYKYDPDYLNNSKNCCYRSDCETLAKSLGLTYKSSDVIIDGGNVVGCGEYIVMTDKVFPENHKVKNDKEFAKKLEMFFGHEIVFIPWHCIDPNDKYADVYGHADGFIKYCGDKKILMSNHCETDPFKASAIKSRLQAKGFNVIEITFESRGFKTFPDYNWAYINFLQVGNQIIMPKIGIQEDNIALEYVQNAFPDCNVHQLEMSKKILDDGGALHCLTWNVKR